jgi:hypothetical protein
MLLQNIRCGASYSVAHLFAMRRRTDGAPKSVVRLRVGHRHIHHNPDKAELVNESGTVEVQQLSAIGGFVYLLTEQ